MDSPFSEALRTSRWGLICLRLAPLLGDVPAALGPAWHEKIEALFSEADLAVASQILSGPRGGPDWFVIRYAPAGRRLDDDGEGMVCAPSWRHAVAALIQNCEEVRCLPSRVSYDRAKRTLRLFVGDALLATISPVATKPISDSLRRRALSTASGLRGATDAQLELLKRVRRWPRLSGLEGSPPSDVGDMQRYREQMVHHPLPKEWLASARLLCSACGQDDPSTAVQQEVAAIALGASSWNHLAGPYGSQSAGLLQPWYLCKDDNACMFYADAFDALADLLSAASQQWGGSKPLTLETGYCFSTLDYVPRYTIREASDGDAVQALSTPSLSINPIILAPSSPPELLARIPSAASSSDEAIAPLFGIGLPPEEKALMLDERAQQVLIVQDGEWRFTRTGDPTDKHTTLWVYRVATDGNCIAAAAVPTYKGLLQQHPATGNFVLCADYDGAHPVAVINGLSVRTVEMVRMNLPDSTSGNKVFREERRRSADRATFAELLQQAGRRHSLA